MSHVRLSARALSDLGRLQTFLAHKDINAAKRAMLVIRETFMPLTHAPMIGRPVEDSDGLRELVIDFGASGYLARVRPRLPPVMRQRADAACRHEFAFEPDFEFVGATHHAAPVGRPFFFAGSSARSWSFRPTLSSAASALMSASSPNAANIRR